VVEEVDLGVLRPLLTPTLWGYGVNSYRFAYLVVVSASSTLFQMLLKDRKPEWLPSFALLKGSHLRFF